MLAEMLGPCLAIPAQSMGHVAGAPLKKENRRLLVVLFIVTAQYGSHRARPIGADVGNAPGSRRMTGIMSEQRQRCSRSALRRVVDSDHAQSAVDRTVGIRVEGDLSAPSEPAVNVLRQNRCADAPASRPQSIRSVFSYSGQAVLEKLEVAIFSRHLSKLRQRGRT